MVFGVFKPIKDKPLLTLAFLTTVFAFRGAVATWTMVASVLRGVATSARFSRHIRALVKHSKWKVSCSPKVGAEPQWTKHRLVRNKVLNLNLIDWQFTTHRVSIILLSYCSEQDRFVLNLLFSKLHETKHWLLTYRPVYIFVGKLL